MRFSRQEYWSGLPFPSPVEHVLSKSQTQLSNWIDTETAIFSVSGFLNKVPSFISDLLAYSAVSRVSLDSVQFSHLVVSNSLRPHGLQHASLHCPSLTPRACSNLCPSSQWCHPTISSSIISFSCCLQSFPVSGSFPMSQFFASDGHSIGASASASVFLMNIQDWFPLGWAGLISLQSKRLSSVFSNTTVQKHQFLGIQLSSWSNSHIHAWLLEKP